MGGAKCGKLNWYKRSEAIMAELASSHISTLQGKCRRLYVIVLPLGGLNKVLDYPSLKRLTDFCEPKVKRLFYADLGWQDQHVRVDNDIHDCGAGAGKRLIDDSSELLRQALGFLLLHVIVKKLSFFSLTRGSKSPSAGFAWPLSGIANGARLPIRPWLGSI